MRLSIIIPYYNSPLTCLFDLLASIRAQLGVDLQEMETILVNDAGEPVPDTFLKTFFPLRVRQISLEKNGGPGAARQAGIDAAQGEYLLFADADDVLHDVGALSQLLQSVGDSDILIGGWAEEVCRDGVMQYVLHTGDMTWMHGKLFRAAYLKEHGIRHYPGLRVHEDSYFLSIAAAYGGKIGSCNAISYVWRWHAGSITRCDGCAYTYRSAPAFVYAQALASRLIERINPSEMVGRITNHVCYIYWMTHTGEWTAPEHAADALAVWEAFKRYCGPYLRYWEAAPQPLKEAAYESARAAAHAPSLVDGEGIYGWIERMRA